MNRPCHLAGTFYPAQPEALLASLQTYMDQAEADASTSKTEREKSDPLMLLLPHAGHIYCGPVIAATLCEVTLHRRIVILAPSHTGHGEALGVWPDGSWQTPLGRVPVDEALTARLCTKGGFAPDTRCHMGEHAVEVLLPWLQLLRSDCAIAPVTVSARGQALVSAAAALAEVMAEARAQGEPLTLIVSSDMNHFAPEEENFRRDDAALAPLLALDPQGLYETVLGRGISMCGILPATLALLACKSLGASRARLTAHTSSAAAGGDTSRVVGYAGVIIE